MKSLHMSWMWLALLAAPLTAIQIAPVAQLDRVPGYEPGGRRFESS